jgi:type I restriction enzyme S subunit
VRFGDLFDFLPKSMQKAADGGAEGVFPFYTSSSIQSKWTDSPLYSDESLVFATGGAAAVHHVAIPFGTSADCLVAVPRNRDTVKPRFYFHFLRWNIRAIESGFRGAGLRHVSKRFLEDLTVPVVPAAEQQKVIQILDRADAISVTRKRKLAKLHTLNEALFLDLFGDPATNPKGFAQEHLGVLGKVTTGNTPARENPENYGDAIEWLKSDNLISQEYYATRAAEGLSHLGKSRARLAPSGAILVTCIAGSPSSIGNAAMVNREVAFNQQINAFVPKTGNPHFFFAQFVVGKRLVQHASTGGMKGLVSKGRFEQILFLNPPRTLQDRFAELSLRIERVKSMSRASVERSDALLSALQYRAFVRES